MKKDLIKKLAAASYSKKGLDGKRVREVSKKLTRGELKEYIRQLKILEETQSVMVIVAEEYPEIKRQFEKIFPNEKVIIKKNKELILGTRIVRNYDVYDLSLKNRLENIAEYVSEND